MSCLLIWVSNCGSSCASTFFLLFFLDNLLLGLLLDRLNLVHVRDSLPQLRVRPKFLFRDTEQLPNIDCLTSVTVNDLEEALSGDAIVLRRIILLPLVALHVILDRVELLGTGRRQPRRLPIRILTRPFTLAEAEKLLHFLLSFLSLSNSCFLFLLQ